MINRRAPSFRSICRSAGSQRRSSQTLDCHSGPIRLRPCPTNWRVWAFYPRSGHCARLSPRWTSRRVRGRGCDSYSCRSAQARGPTSTTQCPRRCGSGPERPRRSCARQHTACRRDRRRTPPGQRLGDPRANRHWCVRIPKCVSARTTASHAFPSISIGRPGILNVLDLKRRSSSTPHRCDTASPSARRSPASACGRPLGTDFSVRDRSICSSHL